MPDITSNLIHHYKLDDGSGTAAVDSGSGAQNGSLAGSVSWGTGKVGGCGVFAGGQIALPTALGIDAVSAFTIAAWVKVATPADFSMIFSHHLAASSRIEFALGGAGVGGSDDLYATVSNGASTGAYTTANLIDTNWHHVAIVLDGSLTGDANRLKVFIDGVQRTLTYQSAVPAATPSIAGVASYVGKRGADSTLPWNGSIDDVRIYARALAGDDVAELASPSFVPASSPAGLSLSLSV